MTSFARMLLVDTALVPFVVVLATACIAGIIDHRRNVIPNWITFSLIGFGLFYHGVLPWGQGWMFALMGGVFGLAILLPFFLLGGVGAGDVKMLSGIGCWVGFHDALAIFLVFGAITGVISIVAMLQHPRRNRSLERDFHREAASRRIDEVLSGKRSTSTPSVIPMAPVMAVAIFLLGAGARIGPAVAEKFPLF